MSNKTSDKNVGSIKRLKQMVEIIPTCDFPKFQMDYDNALLFANDIENILAEREQKDKRIQELEAKLLDMIQGTEIINKETPEYVKENYIPIQVVKDKIKEIKRLRDKCITTEGYNIANGEVVVLQELLEGERK